MNKNLKDQYKKIDDFFTSEPTSNQKAWGKIHDFYHIILTHMDKMDISKADLAKKLGKSRASVTQMFNKTPNITIKKMVEISDAIGLDLHITTPAMDKTENNKTTPEPTHNPTPATSRRPTKKTSS